MNRILVVDDESSIRKILRVMLEEEGYQVEDVATLSEAREVIAEHSIAVILTDMRLAGEDGLDLVQWVKQEGLLIPVIVLTAHGTVDTAVEAMKLGAFDFVEKPFERAELIRMVKKALLTHQFQKHHLDSGSEGGLGAISMIGDHQKMKQVYQLVQKVAPTDSTVLITGESGTGKELIAMAIHELSERSSGPFIKINCAAIPNTLLESELFGHEKGSFTGATGAKPGRFEIADGGTLFLDEVGEMSMEMQVKLLRVLQERAFERVGGLRTIEVDVRLVTATNKDLEEEVQRGQFREDLFYRLNVVPIHLPPLRDRPSDIPLLVKAFSEKMGGRLKSGVPRFTPGALEALFQYSWPGNIRQLENVVERVLVMAQSEEISVEQLPEEIRLGVQPEEEAGSLKDKVKRVTRQIEREAIETALKETQHNVTQAARKLNISRKGLQLKMKELGIR